MSVRSELKLYPPENKHPRHVRARYHLLVYQGEQGFHPHETFDSATLDRGTLLLGNRRVIGARFSQEHVTWVTGAGEVFNSGHLYVHDDGLNIHGVVFEGTSPTDAQEHHFVGTAVKPQSYRTVITKGRYPAGTTPDQVPAEEWENGLDLTVSFEVAVGDYLPRPKVSLGGEDISDNTSWSVDDKGRTLLIVDLDDIVCGLSPQLYRRAHLAFDMFQPTPTGVGEVVARCSDTTDGQPDHVYLWTAQPTQVGEPRAASPAPEELTAAEMGGAALSIAELMTILPNKDVDDVSQSMLLRNMKWAMGQDGTQRQWLADFLDMDPPSIEPDQQALVRQSLDWYQDQFAKAYLTQSFQTYNGAGAATHKLDEEQKKRLQAFFKVDIVKAKDFTVQHQGIFVDAFVDTFPRLRDYRNDTGTGWAGKLYDVLTSEPQFVLMVNRVHGASGDSRATGPLNNFACLLTALQPSADLATKYYKAVMTGVLTTMLSETVHQDHEATADWLPHALQVFLNKVANGEVAVQDISRAEAKAMADDVVKNSLAIGRAVGNLAQSIVAKNFFQQCYKMEDGLEKTFAEKFPPLVKAAKLLVFVGWVGSLYMIGSILGRGGWKNMNGRERAQFLTQCVQTGIQTFEVVPELYGGVRKLSAAAWKKLTSRAMSSEIQEMTGSELQRITPRGEDFVEAAAQELEPVIKAGATGEGTAWARLFTARTLSLALKAIGAITAVVMTGLALWQLIDDIRTGGSVTDLVFEGLSFAAGFLSTACVVIDLFVASACIPIAGAVLALIGVIISVIEFFLHKPKNPVDEWMRKTGIPFVRGLPPLKQFVGTSGGALEPV